MPDEYSIYANPLLADPENSAFGRQSGFPRRGTGRNGKDIRAYPEGNGNTVIWHHSAIEKEPYLLRWGRFSWLWKRRPS